MAEDNTMEWSKKIYNYGYLLSDDDKVTSADIGVEWSDWVCRDVRSGIKLYVHPLAAYFMHKCSARTHVLVGHAFNPFDMGKDETNILNELERRYNDDNLFYLSNDITVPFNNRALLDIMLRTPLEKRKTDALHKDIIKTMDERLFNLGIHVVNGNETHKRAVCERIYYEINTHLPW